jgi:hypothetical protein
VYRDPKTPALSGERRFEDLVFLLCVRWYLPCTYRDLRSDQHFEPRASRATSLSLSMGSYIHNQPAGSQNPEATRIRPHLVRFAPTAYGSRPGQLFGSAGAIPHVAMGRDSTSRSGSTEHRRPRHRQIEGSGAHTTRRTCWGAALAATVRLRTMAIASQYRIVMCPLRRNLIQEKAT